MAGKRETVAYDKDNELNMLIACQARIDPLKMSLIGSSKEKTKHHRQRNSRCYIIGIDVCASDTLT